MELQFLSRRHGIRLVPGSPCSVEDCSLAVGVLVGHGSVKSAVRMNKAAVVFLDSVSKADAVVESGVVVSDTHVPVSPLDTPAVKVTVSNVPPFLKDEELVGELSRYGRVTSQVRKLSSGFRSQLQRHVVSHRRQLVMVLNDRNGALNTSFRVRVAEVVQQVEDEGAGRDKRGQEAEVELADGEVGMEEDEEKAHRLKRKRREDEESSQAKKGASGKGEEESEASLEEDSYSDAEGDSCEEEHERPGVYSVGRIRGYLVRTKNQRVVIDNHFSDMLRLARSIRHHMAGEAGTSFTKQEGYRLRKIEQNVERVLREGEEVLQRFPEATVAALLRGQRRDDAGRGEGRRGCRRRRRTERLQEEEKDGTEMLQEEEKDGTERLQEEEKDGTERLQEEEKDGRGTRGPSSRGPSSRGATLRRLMEVAGPGLGGVSAVASLLRGRGRGSSRLHGGLN